MNSSSKDNIGHIEAVTNMDVLRSAIQLNGD